MPCVLPPSRSESQHHFLWAELFQLLIKCEGEKHKSSVWIGLAVREAPFVGPGGRVPCASPQHSLPCCPPSKKPLRWWAESFQTRPLAQALCDITKGLKANPYLLAMTVYQAQKKAVNRGPSMSVLLSEGVMVWGDAKSICRPGKIKDFKEKVKSHDCLLWEHNYTYFFFKEFFLQLAYEFICVVFFFFYTDFMPSRCWIILVSTIFGICQNSRSTLHVATSCHPL